MMKIKEYCESWKAQIKERMANRQVSFGIVQVGSNAASTRYVRNKIKDCEEVGINATLLHYSEDISLEDFLAEIRIQQEKHDAFMVQLPLPTHLFIDEVVALLDPKKDVDGFTHNSLFKPCTPAGIMKYLEGCGFDPAGKHVTVIGRSEIVGKPMARMLTDADATVTLCHSKTKNLDLYTSTSDLIVCAVGKARFLNCYAIHCPVIDVGINFNEDGKMVGDCFNTEGRNVTPVPGGVGLLTRCALLENISNC